MVGTDYDGTLAAGGVVDEPSVRALRRLRSSGRKLLLVTGRQLDDLRLVFPELGLFDLVVAENGAVLHEPAERTTRALCSRPPDAFVRELARRGVRPLSQGAAIVATQRPHEETVLEVIRDLGLELQVTFNKGAVMVLPSGVNKATGFAAALRRLQHSAHNAVAVGDAENDHSFLDMSELAVAVANALPSLKQRADLVTTADHGAGVTELIDGLLATELRELEPRSRRPGIALGESDGDATRWLPVADRALLIAGGSAGGKTTLAAGLLERAADQGYQYCVVDPEGDHSALHEAVVLGGADQAPAPERLAELLRDPDENAVVNLLAVKLHDRPLAFQALLAELRRLRTRTGRPHFLVVDEAHHLMPQGWKASRDDAPDPAGLILITVHPERVSRAVLESVEQVAIVGEHWGDTLAGFGRAAGIPVPQGRSDAPPRGTAILWSRSAPEGTVAVRTSPPRVERRRHVRKYAAGELGEDESFFFRGPDGGLNLRAQNLSLFVQMASGVDDRTWLWHLRRGDYARWFENAIKDQALAEAAEAARNLDAESSREAIRRAIEQRYTASA